MHSDMPNMRSAFRPRSESASAISSAVIALPPTAAARSGRRPCHWPSRAASTIVNRWVGTMIAQPHPNRSARAMASAGTHGSTSTSGWPSESAKWAVKVKPGALSSGTMPRIASLGCSPAIAAQARVA